MHFASASVGSWVGFFFVVCCVEAIQTFRIVVFRRVCIVYMIS